MQGERGRFAIESIESSPQVRESDAGAVRRSRGRFGTRPVVAHPQHNVVAVALRG